MANKRLNDGLICDIHAFASKVESLKTRLLSHGFTLFGNEPLKITIFAKKYGYTGTLLADMLQKQNIHCEFADPDFIVFMLTPQVGDDGLIRLETALSSIVKKEEIQTIFPAFSQCEKALSVRTAIFSPCETVPTENALGRILASPSVGCPPAVPIVICGEVIDLPAIEVFKYYGIKEITVVK